MGRIKISISVICLIMTAAVSQAAIYGRNVGGSWHETNDTWKISGSYVSTLPGSGDTASLVSADETVDLYEAVVSIGSLVVGSWDATFTKSVTLNVQSNLDTTSVNIGSATSNSGNGILAVSNATVTTGGSTLIGKTAAGALIVDGGGVFQNTAWRIDMGSQGVLTVNDGTVSLVNGLIMAEGARVDINGTSEIWIMGNDQTQSSDPLMQYIFAGWIYGNGVAGNVEVTYDGTKTIVKAVVLADTSLARSAAGSWHDTYNTWKYYGGDHGGEYLYRVPLSGDSVNLTSTENATINLYEESVMIKNLILGQWGGAESFMTLLVNTNLTIETGSISIASTGNLGSGAMVVSNAVVSTIGTTSIGKTSSGSLTVNGGGLFENTAWRVDVGSNGVVTVNDGVVSMTDALLMEDGAVVEVNGDSELWIVGSDQTQQADVLMQYISDGWIYGNGVAGNVTAVYDGSKTIVTAALPEAHLSISCSNSNAVLTSVDLSPLALSNVLQKCSSLGDEWIDVPPVSTGSSSNSWTVPSVDSGEFFRIRSWF